MIDFSARQHGDGMKSPAAERVRKSARLKPGNATRESLYYGVDKKISRE